MCFYVKFEEMFKKWAKNRKCGAESEGKRRVIRISGNHVEGHQVSGVSGAQYLRRHTDDG